MMFPQTADVVIVGGGVMGASAAYHLARSGCRHVVLLERERFFGSESTGKCAGAFAINSIPRSTSSYRSSACPCSIVHLEAACHRMPMLQNVGISSRWAGLYENSPDAHPILGAIDELEGFYCITGFSGHGFMHGPICGLLLAEEILNGRATTLDISSLRMSRFRTGVGAREYNVV